MRTRWLVVAVAVATLVSGCGGAATDQSGTKEAPTIALFLPESKTTRYEAFDRPLFEASQALWQEGGPTQPALLAIADHIDAGF